MEPILSNFEHVLFLHGYSLSDVKIPGPELQTILDEFLKINADKPCMTTIARQLAQMQEELQNL